MHPVHHARRLGAAVAGLVLAGLSFAPAVAAEQAPPASFRLEPVGTPDQLGPNRGWYDLDVEPGDQVEFEVFAHSTAEVSGTAILRAADALTSTAGGIVFANDDVTPRRAGAWLDVAIEQVALSPGQRRAVPVSLTVPEDARPGDHVAGLVLSSTTPARSGEQGEGLTTDVYVRHAVAVVLHVAGDASTAMDVRGVTAERFNDRAELILANTGQLMVAPQVTLILRRGEQELRSEGSVDQILPEDEAAFPLALDAPLDAGDYDAEVRIEAEGMSSITWRGTLAVASGLPASDDTGTQGGGLQVRDALSPWMPFALIAVIASAALVLIMALVRFLQNRARARNAHLAFAPPRDDT